MSSGEKIWPQKYGFKIVGDGPTFIASVKPGSEAEESGLVPGDRLMELDGYDISRLSADVLTILMKETNGHPPAVGVVPSVCPIYLTCKKPQRCGFSVTNKKPITVSQVEPTGLAFAAGLRKGDIILRANDKPISEIDHKELVLIAENERLVLSTIPTGIRENTVTDDFRGPQIKTSKFLFTKVAKYCDKDYHKKMALVGVLTEYSEDWDIYNLCSSLDSLLKEPSDRKLLKHIEPFIPRHQKDVFKPMLKKKKLYKDCQHLAYMPNKVAQKHTFRILRGDKPYGFVIKGNCPVHVEWLDPEGPADISGLLQGDFIVAINEIDVRNFSHEQVIKLLQFCGPVPIVEVERYADAVSEVGMNNSFDTLSSISSTFSTESFKWICNEFRDVTDEEGWTFKQKMEYLLTPKERAELQIDFLQYTNSRNIVKLYQKLEPILDNPSRRSLWQFLLTRMSKSHQEYIHLKENLSETLQDKSTKNLFEYYLNNKEESKMKNALDLYLKNRNFEQVKIMERILNTPAKEELWINIIPHLIPEHSHIIQKQREEQKRIFVETAFDSFHLSNDWLPSNLSSEDEAASIHDISTLCETPDFHGKSISACSSSSLSKTPTIFSPYDFTDFRSPQRNLRPYETQSLVLADNSHDQMSTNRLMPQKPKRKMRMTNNEIPDHKLSSEDLQSLCENQKAPSLPDLHPMSNKAEEFETKRSSHLFEQQINSQLNQAGNETKNPQTDRKELSPLVKELKKTVTTIYIPPESYYDADDDEDDGGGHSKVGMTTIQNETDHRIVLKNKEQLESNSNNNSSIPNFNGIVPAFTYRNANNGYPELTTFGKVKNESNFILSRDGITPDVPEDKMVDDTSRIGYTVTDSFGTQDQPKISHYGPVQLHKTTKDEHYVKTISIKVNNGNYSFKVHEKFAHHSPMGTKELQKTNERFSAFHLYQKDFKKNSQPLGMSYSFNEQKYSIEDIVKTIYTYPELSTENLNHQTNDVHEKLLISAEKPQRLKNDQHWINEENCDTGGYENLNRNAVIFNQNRSSCRYKKMNLKVKNSLPGISLESESKRKKSSAKGNLKSRYRFQVRNQSPKSKTKTETLSMTKKQILNFQFSQNDDDGEEEEQQQQQQQQGFFKPTIDTNISLMERIKELERQKNIPKPPSVLPFLRLEGEKNDVSGNENIKRLFWEKIERNSIQDTIWNKPQNEDIEDILPLLMLDKHFGCKKTNAQQLSQSKKKVSILDPKKVYNISILLGHLKLSVTDIKDAILKVDESVMTEELLQQLLAYAPNETELQKYENLRGKTKDLNQADLFTYEMTRIPNYKDRIKVLIFKANFTDRAEVLKNIIADLKSASLELRTSQLLTNILQLILAMGNYLNRGNERLSGASGFRISFLTQIDNTKTSDNKTTFLHVLATAVVQKFPNSPSLNKELSSVLKVAKVFYSDITNEIKELTSSQKDTTNFLEGIKVCNSSDKIQEIMTNFLLHTKETIEFLSDSLDEALKEFQTTLYYFGESDKNINMQKIFGIFATFVDKFEKSRRDISMKMNSGVKRNNRIIQPKSY